MQVLEGAGERLRHLLRRPHGGIVRKSMVLPVAVGELRLEKKFGAADAAARNCFGERSTHSSFKIMLALVGSVERTKAGAQRKSDQLRGAVFLPCGAVNKCGNLR
jgi:hypothetical protein